MGREWSDGTNPIITDVASGDKLLVLRESDGANGSKIIGIEDFERSASELADKNIYVMSGMLMEPQPPNAIIMIAAPTEDITIPSASNRSAGKALVAATSNTTFSIKKNGTEIGTMSVSGGATVATFNFPSDTDFIAGTDYLTVVNPASPDATLAIFGFSVWARR